MKKTISLFLIFTVLAACSACALSLGKKEVKATGKDVAGAFATNKVTSIEVTRAIHVEYTVGNTTSVTYQAPESIVEYLDIKCKDGELKIGIKDGVNVTFNNRKVTFQVVAPDVDSFEASSAGTIKVNGTVKQRNLDIETSSAGSIVIDNAEVNIAEIEASSASKVNIGKLTAQETEIDASSAAAVVIGGNIGNLEIDASSAARVNVSAVMDKAEVDGSSSAAVVLKGKCGYFEADATSGARVDASGMTVETGDLDATSGGSISVQKPTGKPFMTSKNRSGNITIGK